MLLFFVSFFVCVLLMFGFAWVSVCLYFLSCGEFFAAQAALYLDRLPASLESKRAGETDYSIPCSSALVLVSH